MEDSHTHPTCKVCNSGELHPVEVSVLSPEAAFLGWGYWMLGIFFLLASVLTIAGAFGDKGTLFGPEGNGPLSALLTGAMLVPTMIGSIGLLAVGSILKLKKRHLRCDMCGALTRAE